LFEKMLGKADRILKGEKLDRSWIWWTRIE
jgi:hypothetical protein